MELNFSGPCAEKGNTLIMLMSMRFATVSINSHMKSKCFNFKKIVVII